MTQNEAVDLKLAKALSEYEVECIVEDKHKKAWPPNATCQTCGKSNRYRPLAGLVKECVGIHERWGVHTDSLPHGNCPLPQYCDCECDGCLRNKYPLPDCPKCQGTGVVLNGSEGDAAMRILTHSPLLCRYESAYVDAILGDEVKREHHDNTAISILNALMRATARALGIEVTE